jgi:hypothetical protein
MSEESMERELDEKTTVSDLCREWQNLVDHERLSPEAEYRIRKLLDRTAPVADRIFVKTVKGQQLIRECAERTRDLRTRLGGPSDRVYRSLDSLERSHEELLKKTYEFRVKAG